MVCQRISCSHFQNPPPQRGDLPLHFYAHVYGRPHSRIRALFVDGLIRRQPGQVFSRHGKPAYFL
jgi:hypothetical protein